MVLDQGRGLEQTKPTLFFEDLDVPCIKDLYMKWQRRMPAWILITHYIQSQKCTAFL